MKEAGVDALIASAGSLPLEELCNNVPGLKQVVWVVQKTSRHMDWAGTPEAAQGKLSVSVWHDVVQEHKTASWDLPQDEHEPPSLVQIWLSKNGPPEVTRFTQKVSPHCTNSNAKLTSTESCSRYRGSWFSITPSTTPYGF